MRVSIVIPTMTYRWVKACIESIIKYTDMNDVEIVVVANGGDFTSGDVHSMFPWPNVKLIWYIGPLGAVPAYNAGIKAATGDYIILMNDDCEVQISDKNYWLDELLKPFADPKMAVTGVFRMRPGLAGDELVFDEARKAYGFILFFCAVIPRRIFDEIGILDDVLECGVDVDFCMKCFDKGYKIAQVPEEELQFGGALAIGTFPFFHQGEGTVHDFYGERWDAILKKDAKILNERYGIKKQKKVSIVIPTMTLELVKKCVESIIKYTNLDDVEIIVVGNGGDFKDGYKEITTDVKISPRPKNILFYEPLGPVKALNEGIKAATGEFVLLLNDDCEIMESEKNAWIEMLLKPFSDPKIACVGQELMITHYDKSDKDINWFSVYFHCAMIRRSVFELTGLLDENIKCSVDIDFCLKLNDLGYSISAVGSKVLPVSHVGRATVSKLYETVDWNKIIDDDNYYIENKYKKDKISITITAYGDRLEEIINCIDSIYANTDMSTVEMVIVGNAVSKRVDDYLRRLQTNYYYFSDALGTSGALNEVLQRATGSIKVILNQDIVILGRDWLKMLLEPFKDPTVGATGPLKCQITGLGYDYIHGFCMAISDTVFKKVGLFDVQFNPGGFEDLDYSVRIQQAGYRLVQVPDTEPKYGAKYGFEGMFPIYHMENHGTWLNDDAYKKNYDYFFSKYKKKQSRNVIIPSWPVAQKLGEITKLQELLQDYEIKKVLEIGTYRGGTAMLWANIVAPEEGHVFCADMRFDWGSFHDHGYANIENKTYRRQVYNDSPYEKFITEIQGDTHDSEFVKNLCAQVGEVDLLFIDGDHSYEGVKQDFENYSALVKNGGYIVFHDILETSYHKQNGCNVSQFWNEIKNKYASYEFIDPKDYPGCPADSMGIGVLKMSEIVGKKDYPWGEKISMLEKPKVTGGNIAERSTSGDVGHQVYDAGMYANRQKVTAYISTKDRYNTTLPMAIVGIASQSYQPDELIIIDDGEQKDLRNVAPYDSIFRMLDEQKIKWKVLFGQKRGQVANHQMMLDATSNDFIWRVDDDNFPEGDVLETLMNKICSDDKIGAVASRSLVPGETVPYNVASSKIGELDSKPNVQWSSFQGFDEVDHLHNTFLFRKNAGRHGYHQGLSPAGHREETMFTYGMKLNGWKLYVCGDVITWHFRQASGGIRSFKDQSMWDSDEQLFQQWMRQQNHNPNEFLAVLDAGLGDHLDFLTLLPEIRNKYPNKSITLGTCFPEAFKNESDVKQISIAEAAERLGNIEGHNIYKWMAENNWKSNIKDAYRKMYL